MVAASKIVVVAVIELAMAVVKVVVVMVMVLGARRNEWGRPQGNCRKPLPLLIENAFHHFDLFYINHGKHFRKILDPNLFMQWISWY